MNNGGLRERQCGNASAGLLLQALRRSCFRRRQRHAGGRMYGINIGCLEGVTEEELSKIPITYVDGMHDGQSAPELFSHL